MGLVTNEFTADRLMPDDGLGGIQSYCNSYPELQDTPRPTNHQEGNVTVKAGTFPVTSTELGQVGVTDDLETYLASSSESLTGSFVVDQLHLQWLNHFKSKLIVKSGLEEKLHLSQLVKTYLDKHPRLSITLEQLVEMVFNSVSQNIRLEHYRDIEEGWEKIFAFIYVEGEDFDRLNEIEENLLDHFIILCKENGVVHDKVVISVS